MFMMAAIKQYHWICNVQLPQEEDVKCLGLHLDRRLTRHKHVFVKRKKLRITLTKMLLGRKSKLSTNNKLLIYKSILKTIWTYGIQLWGTASTSNIEILEGFQSNALRMIVDAPWLSQQLKKKSAATALSTVHTSARTQTAK
jgi:hypothetical protein